MKKILVSFFIFLALLLCLDYIGYRMIINNYLSFLPQEERLEAVKHYPSWFDNRLRLYDETTMKWFEEHKDTHGFREPVGLDYKKAPVWMFGCSFVYGVGHQGGHALEDTFGYIFSQEAKRPVYNRAYPSWGVQHMLYQLKKGEIFNELPEPEYVIFNYISDHARRTQKIVYDAFSDGGYLRYKENKDGKMVYADEVAKGESLSVYYNDNGVEAKKAIRLLSNGKEDSFDFIRVSSQFTDEDTEYWTRALFVAQDHPIANVIVQEGHIYNTAQIFDATSKKLSIGDIVALKSEINFDSEFTPVTIYDGTEDGKEIFVKTEILSTYKDDLIAVQTFDSIKAFEAIKPEISYELMEIMVSSLDLSSAISYYINPSITEEKNGEE